MRALLIIAVAALLMAACAPIDPPRDFTKRPVPFGVKLACPEHVKGCFANYDNPL